MTLQHKSARRKHAPINVRPKPGCHRYRRSVPNRVTTRKHPASGGWVGAVFLGSPPTLNTPLVPPGVCGAWPLLAVWDPRFSRAHRQPTILIHLSQHSAKGSCRSYPWCQNASITPVNSHTRATKNASKTNVYPQLNQQTTQTNPICQPNTRQQSTSHSHSVPGTEEHHPVLVYRLELAVLPLPHKTSLIKQACSTSHASKPLRGFSLHWCGAARSVMTCAKKQMTRNLSCA